MFELMFLKMLDDFIAHCSSPMGGGRFFVVTVRLQLPTARWPLKIEAEEQYITWEDP